MKTGEKIKLLREEHQWSQEQLAMKMGYKSRSTINKIELGINEITQSKILAFAKIFSVDPCELVTDEPIDFEKLKEKWDRNAEALSKEVRLLEEIQDQYGKKAVDLLSFWVQLNEEGKKRIISSIEDLTQIEKYRKEGNK